MGKCAGKKKAAGGGSPRCRSAERRGGHGGIAVVKDDIKVLTAIVLRLKGKLTR
jgi:hypothetical protein